MYADRFIALAEKFNADLLLGSKFKKIFVKVMEVMQSSPKRYLTVFEQINDNKNFTSFFDLCYHININPLDLLQLTYSGKKLAEITSLVTIYQAHFAQLVDVDSFMRQLLNPNSQLDELIMLSRMGRLTKEIFDFIWQKKLFAGEVMHELKTCH